MSSFVGGRPKRPKRPSAVAPVGPSGTGAGFVQSVGPGGGSRPSSGYGDRERPSSSRVRPAMPSFAPEAPPSPGGGTPGRPRAPPGSRPWDSSTATARPPRGGRRLIEGDRPRMFSPVAGPVVPQPAPKAKGNATRIAASIYLASSVPSPSGAVHRPRSSTGSRTSRVETLVAPSAATAPVGPTGRSTIQRASTAPSPHPQAGGLGPAPDVDPRVRPAGFARTWGPTPGAAGYPQPVHLAPGSFTVAHFTGAYLPSAAGARAVPPEALRPRQNNFVASAGTSQSSVGGGPSQGVMGAGRGRGSGASGGRAGGEAEGEPQGPGEAAVASRVSRPSSSSGTWAQPAASARPGSARGGAAGGVGQPPSMLRTTTAGRSPGDPGSLSARVRPPSSTGRTGGTGADGAAAVGEGSRPTTSQGPRGSGDASRDSAGKGSGALGGRKSLTYGPGSQSSQGSSGNQTEVVQAAGQSLRPPSGFAGSGSAALPARAGALAAPAGAAGAGATGGSAPSARPGSSQGPRPPSVGPGSGSGGLTGAGSGGASAGSGAASTSGGLADYTIGKVLGEGGFCEVRQGIHQQSKWRVAIKVIDKSRLSDINDRKRVAREIKVLKKLHHVCIIRCFDVIDTPSKIYIVMEAATNGSLLDYVRGKKRLKEAEAAKFLQQVVHGLVYCHSKGVVHRDIKLENLLLDSDSNIRIIDFGLSAITAPGKRLKVFCGSPSYAAPEIVARRQYEGPPVDVWSLGVVLFAMVCGYLPFHAGGDRQALCRKIMKGHYTPSDFISPEVRDLLSQMLTVDPEARISLKQVLGHPWVAGSARWTPPAANRYTITVDARGSPLAHPEIMRRMEALGHARDEVLGALLHREVTHVTATYFLLQDQWIEQHGGSLSNAHAAALVRAATAQGGARGALWAAGPGGAAGSRAQTAPDVEAVREVADLGPVERDGPDADLDASGSEGGGAADGAAGGKGVVGAQPAQSSSTKETVLYGHGHYAGAGMGSAARAVGGRATAPAYATA